MASRLQPSSLVLPASVSMVRGHDVRPRWRFRLLVEIANYAALRRHLGRARAELLCHDLIDRLSLLMPEARMAAGGRALVEVDFESDSTDALRHALGRVRKASSEAFDLDGEQHHLSLVTGAAAGDAQADEVLLAEEAELALSEARDGEDAVAHALNAHARRTDRLAAELDLALQRDEFVLFYQPKVHVRRQQINSAEALIRWQHPERGLILPGDFIQAAEEAQLIDRLTLWTIRRAIADQQAMRTAGYPLRIFINISGQLLADTAFVGAACRLIAESDASIGFEVTETSVIRDPASAIANLQRFADIGIRVSIDDYGAGLSSLAYLKQLPARELKIDKLFVTQLTSSNRDPLIVRSTIDLAHALDMEVVAEGVETHAALALLTVMGCDMVQGFLISRPITLEALLLFLSEDRHLRTTQDTRASFTRLASSWKRG